MQLSHAAAFTFCLAATLISRYVAEGFALRA